MTRRCSLTPRYSNKVIFLPRPKSSTCGHLNKVKAANWTNFWARTTTNRETWVIGLASDTIRATKWGATLTVCWGFRLRATTWSNRRTFMTEICWNLSGQGTATERSTRRQFWRHLRHPMRFPSTIIRLAKHWNQTRTVLRLSSNKMPRPLLKRNPMSPWP